MAITAAKQVLALERAWRVPVRCGVLCIACIKVDRGRHLDRSSCTAWNGVRQGKLEDIGQVIRTWWS